MKSLSWRIGVAVSQLLLAVGLFAYAPFQYRADVQKVGVVELTYFLQHYPPAAQRVSYALNYPAFAIARILVAPKSLARIDNFALMTFWADGGQERVTPTDLVFFFGVVVLWYWLAGLLETLWIKRLLIWPGMLTSICGLVLSITTGTYSLILLFSQYRPLRQIGPFGVLWSLLLIGYFGQSIVRRIKQSRVESPV